MSRKFNVDFQPNFKRGLVNGKQVYSFANLSIYFASKMLMYMYDKQTTQWSLLLSLGVWISFLVSVECWCGLRWCSLVLDCVWSVLSRLCCSYGTEVSP